MQRFARVNARARTVSIVTAAPVALRSKHGRVGTAQDLNSAGFTALQIQCAGHWIIPTTVARYTARYDVVRDDGTVGAPPVQEIWPLAITIGTTAV